MYNQWESVGSSVQVNHIMFFVVPRYESAEIHATDNIHIFVYIYTQMYTYGECRMKKRTSSEKSAACGGFARLIICSATLEMCDHFLRKFMLVTQRNTFQASDLVPEQAHQLHLFANPQIIFLIWFIYIYMCVCVCMYAWILCIHIYLYIYICDIICVIHRIILSVTCHFPKKNVIPCKRRDFFHLAQPLRVGPRNGRGATTPGRARPLEPSWTSWASGPLEISMRKNSWRCGGVHR